MKLVFILLIYCFINFYNGIFSLFLVLLFVSFSWDYLFKCCYFVRQMSWCQFNVALQDHYSDILVIYLYGVDYVEDLYNNIFLTFVSPIKTYAMIRLSLFLAPNCMAKIMLILVSKDKVPGL